MSITDALTIPALTGYYSLQSKLGLHDENAIQDINRELLDIDMPVLERGVLYVEAAGIASRDIARKAAELYESGDYDKVIFTGGITSEDDKYAQQFGIRPEQVGWMDRTPESYFACAEFIKALTGQAKKDIFESKKPIYLGGHNMAEKYFQAEEYLEGEHDIQIVSLLPTARRSIQTASKELGADKTLSVVGVEPETLDLNRNNWHESDLGYTFLMIERAKTLGIDGGEPLFAEFFNADLDLEQMAERVYMANADDRQSDFEGHFSATGRDAVFGDGGTHFDP